jgi:hypothetical protein
MLFSKIFSPAILCEKISPDNVDTADVIYLKSMTSRWHAPIWHKTCVTVHGIEVRGSREFAMRTREALALLRTSSQYELIRSHIRIIRQARRSGMKAWIDQPTFQVGAATWQHSPLWYACAIAHDAYHAKLYRDAKTNSNGAAPERNT